MSSNPWSQWFLYSLDWICSTPARANDILFKFYYLLLARPSYSKQVFHNLLIITIVISIIIIIIMIIIIIIRGPSDNTSIRAHRDWNFRLFQQYWFRVHHWTRKSRLKRVTGDKLELTNLFQRLCIAIQRGNERCFNGTFVPRWCS